MRAVVITKHGDPSVLQVQERPDPVPGPGQVRIAVRAAGVNFADTLARVGMYDDAPKPPMVVGYEVAGTIAAVGGGRRRRAGRRARHGRHPLRRLRRAGGRARRRRDRAARGAVVRAGRGDPGQLRHGVGGPAGLRLAAGRRARARPRGGGRRRDRRAAARKGGAAPRSTARRRPASTAGWPSSASTTPSTIAATAGGAGLRPYDLILDAIGGTSFRRSYDLLRPGGRLVAYGASSVQEGETRSLRRALPQAVRMLRGFNLIKQMSESKAVIGLNMLRLWDDRGTLEPWIAPLSAALADGTVRPVVHAAVPFAQRRRRPSDARRRARTSGRSCWCP